MIRLFNSMTQRKEEFIPRTEGEVGIYCCGPTVYGLVHIGNARPYVTFAVLRNWLRHRGLRVTLVENITDVDDKIIDRAAREGRSAMEVAEEFTRAYHEDMGRLGERLCPDVEPRATEMIAEIIDLCRTLIAKSYAYEADGSVYFKVRSFASYGKLSGQRVEELEQGVRVASEPGKRDPLDFALWKAAKPGEPAWESPWGMGRPGWHIECSAMGLRYLGPGFDIHGGGRDLIFPHHENEIAQSEAAGLPFARVWMHNGMIRSEGAKMAKSVGNIFLLREVLDRYADAENGDAPIVLLYFLTTHYRSPLEFSVEKLEGARASYERLTGFVRDIDFRLARSAGDGGGEAADLASRVERCRAAFEEHMDDDLNTAAALGELFALIADTYRYLAAVDRGEQPLNSAAVRAARDAVTELADLLLIRLPAVGAVRSGTRETPRGAAHTEATDGVACVTEGVVLPPAARLAEEGRWGDLEFLYRERLACGDPSYAVALRDHSREQKDWARSDTLRAELQDAGFEVRDTKIGTQVVSKAR
ncbi:MAG: cysteine--tRNA ligase [Actinobacteria bacterium]|nr:cysteine--tRNA ligase [Actinomycetota bacterium]